MSIKLKEEVIDKSTKTYNIKVNYKETISAESIYDLYNKMPSYNSYYNYYLIEKICTTKYEETKNDDYLKNMNKIVDITLRHFANNNIINDEESNIPTNSLKSSDNNKGIIVD